MSIFSSENPGYLTFGDWDENHTGRIVPRGEVPAYVIRRIKALPCEYWLSNASPHQKITWLQNQLRDKIYNYDASIVSVHEGMLTMCHVRVSYWTTTQYLQGVGAFDIEYYGCF